MHGARGNAFRCGTRGFICGGGKASEDRAKVAWARVEIRVKYGGRAVKMHLMKINKK